MTRWHSDNPVTAVRPVQALPPVSRVAMFLTPPAARVSLATARAFYARKLRFWAKTHAAKPTDES